VSEEALQRYQLSRGLHRDPCLVHQSVIRRRENTHGSCPVESRESGG
jgi:hypothetical protein